MFDAKKILDLLVAAQGAPGQSAPGMGPQGQAAPGGLGQGGLGGLLGQVISGLQQPGGAQPQASAGGGYGQGGHGQGGLGGLLGQVMSGLQQPAGAQPQAPGQGGLGGMLGAVLGQLSQGAQQAGQAGSGMLDQAQGRLAGTQYGDVFAKVRELAGQNPAATTAIMGTLAGLLVGTKTGRGIAGSAVQLGGVALIGGLAYKAFSNYQSGKPLMAGVPVLDQLTPAPEGSGFEPAAQTNDGALAMIRAMIAAAAADGVIDASERAAILGGLKQFGVDEEAAAFLEQELAYPASYDDIVAAATSQETAVQLYTAARVAIDPDTIAEQEFLRELGARLGLDAELVANIEAAAAQIRVG